MMFVEMMVPCCDVTETSYRGTVMGAGALAQGATGRWCVVMYLGPEYIREHGIVPLSYEDAVALCMKRGGEIDF